MSGCLKVYTMHKVSKILLEIASIGWIVFVIIAIIMTLSSCGTTKKCCEKTIDEVYKYEGMYVNQEWENIN